MHYAAYGSNLHPRRLLERTPSAQLLGSRCVPGWSLKFHKRSKDNSAKCNATPQSAGLYVAIYEISDADKAKLDGIEGVGYGYCEGVMSVPDFSTNS